jgi:hypothetical protein
MNRVDQKGKMYTERVRKAGVRVLISTVQGVIEGNVFLAAGERVKDLLNSNGEDFLAVTEATVEWHAPASPIPRPAQAQFIALNKQHIVWVVPLEQAEYAPEEEYRVQV